jgi:hypothetical protein
MELIVKLNQKELDQAVRNYIRDVKKLRPLSTPAFINSSGNTTPVFSCSIQAELDETRFKAPDCSDEDDF